MQMEEVCVLHLALHPLGILVLLLFVNLLCNLHYFVLSRFPTYCPFTLDGSSLPSRHLGEFKTKLTYQPLKKFIIF